jgi:oxygen-independent coproporphyrinogen-3 oxidase
MQSAFPHVLDYLGRAHRHADLVAAVERVRAAGFVHLNLDLIYASPAESDSDWRLTLEAALELEPDHLSAYALSVEPGTPLGAAVASGRKQGTDEDVAAGRLDMAVAVLESAGFTRYEISNWARGEPCLHNMKYWSLGPYVGVGNGAHSYLPVPGPDPDGPSTCLGGLRTWNHRHPRTYVSELRRDGSAVAGGEWVTGDAALLEWLSLGLRRKCGVGIADELVPLVPEALLDAGLVELNRPDRWRDATSAGPRPTRVALTPKGMALANAVVLELSLAFGEC